VSARIPEKQSTNASPTLTLFSLLLTAAICLFRPSPVQASGCPLNAANGRIKHVIYIQFDNTHFTRDNPNVPSDLEQMPHLLNFLENNGTVLTNHHTPLISHTANDILTSFTGVYPDRHGVPVANSFRYFNPNGTSNPGVSFAYWTDPIFDPSTTTPTDTTFNMLSADGKNAPAPWVSYTRAGCNFGGVGTANMVLENTATDIPTVFGAGSQQAQEVQSNQPQAFADFVGIGIHCAAGDSLCSTANGGEQDALPDEPDGYSGFNALFGHKYVAPQISPSGPLTDLNGNVIQDPNGHVGFPGFDGMSAAVSLSYVAAMQEHGVPVTFAYISDAHDKHPTGPAYGPGEAGYVAALAAYDDAFNKFFTRLAQDGITKDNALFIVTADEGDHFVGGAPSPANCDGIHTPCTYAQIGEINTNLAGLLATERSNSTPFTVHSDHAFAKDLAALTAVNPITGNTDSISEFLADPVEMKLLHMVTADPARTPTLTMFADSNYFLFAGAPNCNSPCVVENPGFAWNHGDVQSDISTTWLGMVGPGVENNRIDKRTWSDHTDIRPTMMLLLGLQDDYSHDGRALVENLRESALPSAVRHSSLAFTLLASEYKQITAPVGKLGLASLAVSTAALKGDDPTYDRLENRLISVNSKRDALAAKMIKQLEDAEFNNKPVNPFSVLQLVFEAESLLHQVHP